MISTVAQIPKYYQIRSDKVNAGFQLFSICYILAVIDAHYLVLISTDNGWILTLYYFQLYIIRRDYCFTYNQWTRNHWWAIVCDCMVQFRGFAQSINTLTYRSIWYFFENVYYYYLHCYNYYHCWKFIFFARAGCTEGV